MNSSSQGTYGGDEISALIESIHLSPIATLVTDCRVADNPIIAVNQSFCALTGYRPEEVIGRNCRFLGGSATEESSRRVLRDAIGRGQSALTEITNYRKDGTAFRNAVMVAPVRDGSGEVALFVGSQMDMGSIPAVESVVQAGRRELVDGLSRRQRQVLRLMTEGLRNKQIAAELEIDEKTVKFHRALLLKRLGARTSADAIRIGVEAGIASD